MQRGNGMTSSREEFAAGHCLTLEADVQWRDMDAFQHVNNISYLIWFERIRIAFMERFGGDEYHRADGLAPVLASVQCKYRFPLTYPDRILIGVAVRDVQEDGFIQDYAVYSLGHNVVAAQGEGRLVYFDFNKGGKTAIPPGVKARLLELSK